MPPQLATGEGAIGTHGTARENVGRTDELGFHGAMLRADTDNLNCMRHIAHRVVRLLHSPHCNLAHTLQNGTLDPR
jgi:hypothetical protein